MATECYPTYGEMIELLETHSDAYSLYEAFKKRYPHLEIGRSDRFFHIVKRIAAPCYSEKVSVINEYKQRLWKPRIRNHATESPVFPILEECGLSEDFLVELIEKPTVLWQLECPSSPSMQEFYSELHNFVKKSPRLKTFSKSSIGQLYSKIDPYLSTRNFRSDNAYRYVERLVSKYVPKKPELHNTSILPASSENVSVDGSLSNSSEPPLYNDTLHTNPSKTTSTVNKKVSYKPRNVDRREYRKNFKIKSLQEVLKKKNCRIKKIEKLLRKRECTINELQEEIVIAERQLELNRKALERCEHDYQRKMHEVQTELQSTLTDFEFLEEFSEHLQSKNASLKSENTALKKNCEMSKDINLQTKNGSHYSPAIRKMYYNLLASQVPTSKIRDIVLTVLECFFPDYNVSSIMLPKETCAAYMRREELATLGNSQKAHILCEQIKSGKPFHLNSDGTTKDQHKINGVAINGLVLSINEVSDGSAATIIEDIGNELDRLRKTAHQLNLPNADAINWTLFSSSTADSASTQKKLNKLLQDHRDTDEERYGPFENSGIEIIQNFCAMHLGVNLRKAFVHVVSPVDTESSHQYAVVDSFVHAFAKEFGAQGTPEYGAGCIKFPNFLEIRFKDSNDRYYQECLKVRLARQIGSRYFVTAANACKVLYLVPAAIEFLQFNGMNETSGNKLEKQLYVWMQDPAILALLKADALMFYFVYSNLTNLAKNSDINKSVLDMNDHYLELLLYLEEVEKHPEVVRNKDYQVFHSEQQLYIDLEKNKNPVWTRLFQEDSFDGVVFEKMSFGAAAMKEKLQTYASSQLPGGEYWCPDSEVKKVLSTLKPTNDLCESILGLNDYLTSAIPNMKQLTKSTMVTIKKNKTFKWLQTLPKPQQDELTLFAMKQRRNVAQAYSKEQSELKNRHQKLMIRAKQRREMLQKKAAAEKEALSTIRVISNGEELDDLFATEGMTANKKLAILREQIRVRKKIYNQKVSIPFTHSRKKRPLPELIQEFKEFIAANTPHNIVETSISPDIDPVSLVGKRVFHRFIDESNESVEKWYEGFVLGYNAATRLHEIAYVEEEQNFFYNLIEDLVSGDIKFDD